MPRRSPAAWSGDAIRLSAKDGKSYAEILKAMEAKVDLQNSGAEVLSIRRTRREKSLLVLKRGGGGASALEKSPEWGEASLDRRGILVCPRGNSLE